MKQLNKQKSLLLNASFASLVAVLAGCSQVVELAYLDRIFEKDRLIVSLLADQTCNADTQCKVLSLDAQDLCSAKSLFSYSTLPGNEAAILKTESERRDLITQSLLLQGQIPTCAVVGGSPLTQAASASCVAQRCQLRQ
jgi:hypothetical protein